MNRLTYICISCVDYKAKVILIQKCDSKKNGSLTEFTCGVSAPSAVSGCNEARACRWCWSSISSQVHTKSKLWTRLLWWRAHNVDRVQLLFWVKETVLCHIVSSFQLNSSSSFAQKQQWNLVVVKIAFLWCVQSSVTNGSKTDTNAHDLLVQETECYMVNSLRATPFQKQVVI